MDALEVLKQRRSERKYDPNYQIPKENLKKIVDAALNSPTALNCQGTDIIVVTNKSKIDQVEKVCVVEMPPELKEKVKIRQKKYGIKNTVTFDSTCLILIVKNERAGDYVIMDTGFIAMSILVAAKALGLGSVALGSIINPKVEEIFDIPKGNLLLGVAIGKSLQKEFKEKEILMKAIYVE